jgi:hypothetical protein
MGLTLWDSESRVACLLSLKTAMMVRRPTGRAEVRAEAGDECLGLVFNKVLPAYDSCIVSLRRLLRVLCPLSSSIGDHAIVFCLNIILIRKSLNTVRKSS